LIKRFFKISELKDNGTIVTLDPEEADIDAGSTVTLRTLFDGFVAKALT
jgi:hypothetical protein